MSHSRSAAMDKPVSVEQLVRDAGPTFFDVQFSMANWFRTADLMLKQASIYEHEGNDQMAYLLLYRHANLVLETLPAHPHAKDAQYRQQWIDARKAVRRSLGKMEVLKPRINKRHERYQERLKTRTLQNACPLSEGADFFEASNPKTGILGGQQDAQIDTDEHKDLAVRLANREIRRRMRTDQELETDAEDTTSLMVAARRQLDQTLHTAQAPNPRLAPHTTYNYPSADRRLERSWPTPQPNHPAAPALPPKSHLDETRLELRSSNLNPPPRPEKLSNSSSALASRSSTPEATHQFATTSHTEGGAALRTIFLPSPLRHSFLRYAAANTSRNLETCGILCGTLIQNAFFISKLVIPAQTSTSDTCEMIDEAALYEYCDSQPEELMVLGWIHTHPTQTCFMSSRDLHTHVWYQVQLPESVAIVCSPSKTPDWGIFRLTDPPGMQAIRTCKQPGIFHPHAETHLFTDTLGRPGHVVEHADLQFEVVDLRGK